MPLTRSTSSHHAFLSPVTPHRYAEPVNHSPAPTHPASSARGAVAAWWALAAWRALALVYLVALAWIVLTPADVAGQATGIVTVFAHALASMGVPFAAGYPVLEFTANIALFVPFGAAAVFAVPLRAPAAASTLIVIGAGCLASTAIELTQLGVPGRVSAVSDVLANTLGTALGLALAWWVCRTICRRQARRRIAECASARPVPPAARRRGSAPPST